MSDRRNTAAERADEYVLGLLNATEMSAFEAEMETDQMLRVAVARTRDRFLELDLAGRAEPIDPDLWSRIEASLGVGDKGAAAPQITTASANDNHRSRWRWAALSAITASAVLAVALGYAILDRPRPQVIAVLMDGTGAPLVVVEDFGDTHPRLLRSLELADLVCAHSPTVVTSPLVIFHRRNGPVMSPYWSKLTGPMTPSYFTGLPSLISCNALANSSLPA
jgi:anti-sigma-K factor RskA